MRELGPVAPTAQALRISVLAFSLPLFAALGQLYIVRVKDKTFVRFNLPICGEIKMYRGWTVIDLVHMVCINTACKISNLKHALRKLSISFTNLVKPFEQQLYL
ncbi:hypothetical protein BD408DRAFT_426874 [Parasitella parasitica]|nr:hypothetical protein BD408DRAFT_426874 [Parasitella parasitica]